MKIGPSAQGYSEAVKQWARVAPTVKLIDDPGIFRDAPDSAVRVFRAYTGDGNTDVHAVLNTILGNLKGYRHPLLYVEIINEPSQWDAGVIDFTRAMVPLLYKAGLKVAAPCWSTGTPEEQIWQRWRDEAWCGIDAIALHAYWGNEGFTPWHALRFARFWQQGDPPVLITECGRDAIEGGKGGWQRDGLTKEQYVAELFAWDAELMKLPYVLGATPFTGAPTDPRWEPFNTDPLVPLILAGQPAPQPPQPQPEPPPVSNDAIARKYNLIVTETPTIGVAFEDDTSGGVELVAYCPPDLYVKVRTADNNHSHTAKGRAALVMGAEAKYFPELGQHGFYVAECEGAKVDGLGMKPDHSHPITRFYRKSAPQPEPEPPPSGAKGWSLAFADYAAGHPHIGDAVGPIAYVPQDVQPWPLAVQCSRTHLLVWDGAAVHEIVRKA